MILFEVELLVVAKTFQLLLVSTPFGPLKFVVLVHQYKP